MARSLRYNEAIREATDQCMDRDPRVYVMGLGATDPKGVFGTTLGLEDKYGPKRVMDMPTSENGMTGVAIGSALLGMRPIMTHQRVDFTYLLMDQLANNAAKWHYMFGGRLRVPLVVRMVIGRGWGQGPQHSQSLQAIFAHIPGLKVVMPATPFDAKGLLVAAVEDDNPVVYLEHRWLHETYGSVPEELYTVRIGAARVARQGSDVTIVAASYVVLEALRAADVLAAEGIDVEVIDLRSIKPLDAELLQESVRRTGRLIVADNAWKTAGFGAEIVAQAVEHGFGHLRSAPRRVAFPDAPTPTSPALARHYYPGAFDLVVAARELMGVPNARAEVALQDDAVPQDVPDLTFAGPF